ncbi:Putative GntR-family regulatory protein [Pseudomonas [fluorescens] SBW25]|uniref:GntR-family regulatory protein n=1 Tax=Pseudomonas fluorescens (strain SBW25) TaxID=216595 RepID=C3K770_PSEFS|nr:Putative GntR-family regulatory protein [Pseudomonas fluorescens SBW25]
MVGSEGGIVGITEQRILAQPKCKPRSLTQQVVMVLTERIRSGQLKRGDQLPTESQLMAEQGVSRTVVREVMSRLQAAGQVETRHGIGSFVLSPPCTDSFRLDPSTMVTIREVLAILELRIALEIESAGLAAQRRSDAQLADMRAALDELNEGAAHSTDKASADYRFHQCIAQASGNRYFTDIINHLGTGIIPRTWLDSARLGHHDQASYMLRLKHEHEAIYDAVARRDSEGARMAMRMHLSRSKEQFGQAHEEEEIRLR